MTDASVRPRPARESGFVSTVALVGFMGAGKTTVGQALADRLGWRFADLDQLIEAREGRTVPQIFEQEGEPGFRELEQVVLTEALNNGLNCFVLALGGGAFVSPEVRQILRLRGIPAIWLDAPAEELFRRCDQPGVVRPLRQDPDQFTKLYEQRLPSYRQADLHVITTSKEISTLVEEIIAQFALGQTSRSVE
ncbi:MAG TPA: shikimate kinase [Terriglobales bacterium]|nr:shikimate kinase [Terriglobales bacterium]